MKKTLLITGASTGIGRATALLFAEKGWNVIATMRNPGKSDIKHDNILLLPLDVTNDESITKSIETGIEKFGSIDVVVNNAGYGLVGAFEASTDTQIQKQFDTNVFGVMRVIRNILPHMRSKKSGIIINIASMGGRITFPLYSLYHGTKWAVEGFTEALTYELRDFGITLKIIEPGPIKTDFYDRSPDTTKQEGLTAYNSFIDRVMPGMNKAGETGSAPEVVAKTIYQAATDGSNRLRYPADPQAKQILFLRKILPDCMFIPLVRKIVKA